MEKNKNTIYSFLGLPASGKGTQAQLLADKLGIYHIIGIGDLIREIIMIENNDPFVQEIKKRYDEGIPQPDNVANDLITKFLNRSGQGSVIFDNYPFTENQSKYIDRFVEKSKDWQGPIVIHIKIDPNESIIRATNRKICTSCGQIYKVTDEMICEKCGGSLVVRADDNEETVQKRIDYYVPLIKDVVDHYKKSGGRIIEIDGSKTIEEVEKEIESKLNG